MASATVSRSYIDYGRYYEVLLLSLSRLTGEERRDSYTKPLVSK